jgi:hypothetical protein
MSAPKTTQTVQNGGGVHGPRDVVWGTDAKKVVAWIIGLLVTILGWSVVDRLSMEHRVTVVERGEFTPTQKEDLKGVVKAAVRDELYNYPTKAELDKDKADLAAKVVADYEETQRQLRAMRREFKDDAMYNRRVLSTIDLTKPKKKEDNQ